MEASYIAILFLLQVLVIVKGQNFTTVSVNNETGSVLEFTEPSPPTTTTTVPPPTTTVAVKEDINPFMSVPVNLTKVSATSDSITINVSPPEDYLTDRSYNFFRVEYFRVGQRTQIDKREKQKSSPDLNSWVITGLKPGTLYTIFARSQGRDLQGNYVLSPASMQVQIRTKPPPVLNLKAQQQLDNKKNVIISWNGLATTVNEPMYDKFVLKYYDVSLPDNITYIEFDHRTSLVVKQPNLTYIAKSLILGATYNFSVYTENNEVDPTISEEVYKAYTLKIPGPKNLTKEDFTEKSIMVSFITNPIIENIAGHLLTYKQVDSAFPSIEVNLSTDTEEYNITELEPGAIYSVKVRHILKNALNGNKTDSITIYARTKPLPPQGVEVDTIGTTSITLDIEVPLSMSYSSMSLRYVNIEKNLSSETKSYDKATTSVTINGLIPGGLYNIYLTYLSRTNLNFDETNATTVVQLRTIPYPPSNFVASSRQGKIILDWEKPKGIERPILWSYEIQYFPIKEENPKVTRISLWNRDGAAKMFHSLDDIIPGTSYEVVIYTIAGSASSGVQSRSSASSVLKVFSQPQNPILDKWIQVSLKLIRLTFKPPSKKSSNFDYYLLNISRIQTNGNAVKYIPEQYSHKISSNETSKLLTLTPGAVYRVVLTTVVAEEDLWLQSVVNASNNKVFTMWSPYDSHALFSRLEWKFDNCQKLGRFGPSQILCDNSYKDTNLKDLVVVKNGIQHWTVPMEGLYRIIGAGAGYEGQGGKGATVAGLYHLKEGSRLKIAVGQLGDSNEMSQGGAGGTFVVADDSQSENEPLLVAGGAGTSKDGLAPSNITNGQLRHSGSDASLSGLRFGKGGRGDLQEPGLKGTLNTAGGAGYRGVSDSFVLPGDTALPATGYLPLGLAGQNFNDTDATQFVPLLGGRYSSLDGGYSEGGFGGGGNGFLEAAGGGGGYSGGGGGPLNGYSGGGGSYIKFTGGRQYGEVDNDGPGFVKITLVGLPVSSPVPLTMYLVVAFFVGIVFTLLCGTLLCWVDKCIGRDYNPKKGSSYLNMEDIKTKPTVGAPVAISGPEIIRTTADLYSKSEYETTVPVVSSSPQHSGLYVRDVPLDGANLVTSADSQSDYSSDSSDENEYNMSSAAGSRAPVNDWEKNIDLESKSDDDDDDDSKSESTASSISSINLEIEEMGTEIESSALDTEQVTSQVEESSSNYSSSESDSSSNEHSSDEDGESMLPPTPPPPPKAEELLSEEQRAAFRKKLEMFHSMQASSGAIV